MPEIIPKCTIISNQFHMVILILKYGEHMNRQWVNNENQ